MPVTLQGGADGPQGSVSVGGVAVQCFVPLDTSGNAVAANGALIATSTPASDYPLNAVPLTAASGSVAAAVATATLAAAAAAKTWITGFEVTGAGATAGLAVLVTVTGVVTGTLTYVYCAAAGVLVANTPLIVQFSRAIPSSAVNTAIAVSCPSLGTGNTNNSVVAHGYQL